MAKKLPIIFCWLLAALFTAQAQDVHFTQFQLAPLSLNPALTGAYNGTFRVGLLYRDQWASIMPQQFVTPTVYIDAPLRGFGKRDWIGIGGSLLNDKAGTASLTNTVAMASLAYHFPLNSKTVLTIGAQGGLVQRRLDLANVVFEEEILGGTPSKDRSDYAARSFADFQAGVALVSVVGNGNKLSLGVAAHHLTAPESSLLNGSAFALPRRYVAHGELAIGLTDWLDITPAFLYQKMESAQYLAAQATLGFLFGSEREAKLGIGGGYRSGDAAEALIGLTYKGFRVGFAYDFTLSGLRTATSSKGSFELGGSYIARIFKKPKAEQKVLCPRF
jgi:type IX secretion system PorP/SprF family membrane protein